MITDNLREGVKYSGEALEKIFNFEYKGRAGIKISPVGYIVLFSNDNENPYDDKEVGNIILYEGQNTGTPEQELIYGNKALYEAYTNGKPKILFFKNYVFRGEHIVVDKPYKKNAKWIFPLVKGLSV